MMRLVEASEVARPGRPRGARWCRSIPAVGLALSSLVLSAVPQTAASSSSSSSAAAAGAAGAAAQGRARVVLFGDSLAFQAAPYFAWIVEAGGRATVTEHTFGGTNVCDWLPTMRRAAGEHPQAVVLEFVGNTFTRCMAGCTAGSAAAVARTCTDLAVAVKVFRAAGARVYLVGTPVTRAQWVRRDPHRDQLNRRIAALAAASGRGVAYVDAGRAVEGRGGAYTAVLPCLYFEPCTGPLVAGVRNDVVRSPDGVHFCPGESGDAVGVVGGCTVYSSGAFRFAAAMAGPVIRDLRLGRPAG